MKRQLLLIIAILVVSLGTANAAAPVPFRLGTGGEGGAYFKSAGKHLIQQVNAKKIAITRVPGAGTEESIERLIAGELDGAFVQPDGLVGLDFEYEIVNNWHPEFGHLITLTEKKMMSIKDVKKGMTVAIGRAGGGSAVTWGNFGKQDKRYLPTNISTIPLSGSRALSKLEAGKIDAIFRVCGLRDAEIMRANKQKGKFTLANIDDWDLNDKVHGVELYKFTDIDDDVYPNLITGMTRGSAESIEMKMVFIVAVSWINTNEALYDTLYDAAAKAVPHVLKDQVND